MRGEAYYAAFFFPLPGSPDFNWNRRQRSDATCRCLLVHARNEASSHITVQYRSLFQNFSREIPSIGHHRTLCSLPQLIAMSLVQFHRVLYLISVLHTVVVPKYLNVSLRYITSIGHYSLIFFLFSASSRPATVYSLRDLFHRCASTRLPRGGCIIGRALSSKGTLLHKIGPQEGRDSPIDPPLGPRMTLFPVPPCGVECLAPLMDGLIPKHFI